MNVRQACLLSLLSVPLMHGQQQTKMQRKLYNECGVLQDLVCQVLSVQHKRVVSQTELTTFTEQLCANDVDFLSIIAQELYAAVNPTYRHQPADAQKLVLIAGACEATRKRLLGIKIVQEIVYGCYPHNYFVELEKHLGILESCALALYNHVAYACNKLAAVEKVQHDEQAFAQQFFMAHYEQDHGVIASHAEKKALSKTFSQAMAHLFDESIELTIKSCELSQETFDLLPKIVLSRRAQMVLFIQRIITSVLNEASKQTCIRHIDTCFDIFMKLLDEKVALIPDIGERLQQAAGKALAPREESKEEAVSVP